MGKNKLSRFAENATFDHVVQPSFTELQAADLPQKGKWNSDFFKRDALLVLELGCGGGEYTVGLAQLRPEKNYLGVDIKGARIWRGAKTAKEKGLDNVGFLRTHCLLYTSDAADERSSVDLGGRRIIKKKKNM